MNEYERKELQNLNDRKRLLENDGKELSLEEMKKWESLTMRQALEEQKDSLARRDKAFWGYVDELVPRDHLGHGYHLQQILTCEITDKENPEKRVSYSPMKRMGVLEDRYAMIGMFALMKGMKLDEILSEDPKLKDRKYEIGKEFIETMRFKDSSLSEHNHHVSKVLQEMHDAFAGLSSDFIVNTDIPSLSKNIKKLAFVTQVCKSLKECRHDDVIKEAYDEEKNINKLDEKEEQTKSVRKIRIYKDYCDYVATDDYIKDVKLDIMGQGRIYKAYWAKTEMDLIASKCEKTETLGGVAKELYDHNADKKMSDQKDAFIDAMWKNNLSDKEWVAKANAYIRTGENPMHFYNQDNQMFPSRADESWKDFEVLDFNEENKLESKGTLMSWNELELEEKKSKVSRHKPARSISSKTEEMKKEKNPPKLEKKFDNFK